MEHPHVQTLNDVENQERTYLDFLFDEVRPRVEERLADHPESDPILEVATSILLELFPDYWVDAEGALIDEWSPRNDSPPPPPKAGAGPPAPPPMASEPVESETDDGTTEIVDSSEELDEISESDAEFTERDGATEDAEDDEVATMEQVGAVEDTEDEPAPDESAQGLGEDADVEDGVQDIDDIGALEEKDAEAGPPAGFVNAVDDTAEFAPPPIERDAEKPSVWPQRLDDEAVLHGARILLAVLLDNQRLPAGEQLSPAEVLMAADLWVHLMAQDTELDERVQKLARLVEKKFGSNHFSQARLLLQLFPANTETRVNNDRQLFYEDMIFRLGIRRSRTVSAGDAGQLVKSMTDVQLGDDEAVRNTLNDLADTADLDMHVYTRRPAEVDQWRKLIEKCERPSVESYVLSMIPPRQWRQIDRTGERTVQTALREHIVRPMARDYVIGHIKTCYFVLRAVGDTGLEPYLDSFFDWSTSCCQVEATAFLPQLHQLMSHSGELIESLFTDIYERRYADVINKALDDFDDAALNTAFSESLEQMAATELGEVAPGNFDLGSFVLDSYLEFEHPTPEFAFKMYRLT